MSEVRNKTIGLLIVLDASEHGLQECTGGVRSSNSGNLTGDGLVPKSREGPAYVGLGLQAGVQEKAVGTSLRTRVFNKQLP